MSLKKIEPRYNVDLKRYTSLKVGGHAKHFFDAHSIEELQQLIKEFGFSFYTLGKGSNLLIKDSLIEKPVIKLAKEFAYIKKTNNSLEAGASTPLSSLINYCIKNNLKGFENLIGIPAMVGGLLVMNASSFSVGISDYLTEVDVIDEKGEIKVLKKNDITFSYRRSSIQNYIILGARFNLPQAKDLKQKVAGLLKRRYAKQDFSYPSCGCIFKNPKGETSAGFLIDSCGLKGQKHRDAQISPKHANFIINLGSAKYDDVDFLIKEIKNKVYKKHNVLLEEEIKRWA